MPKITLYPKSRINCPVKRDSDLCHSRYLLSCLQSTPILLRTCPCFWELFLHHCRAVPIQDLSIAPLPCHIANSRLAPDSFLLPSHPLPSFLPCYFCTDVEKVNQFLSSELIINIVIFPTKANTKMSICLGSRHSPSLSACQAQRASGLFAIG